MKTYYCVATTVHDSGTVTSNVIDCIETKEKPQSTMKSTSRADYYSDWFEFLEEAEEFARTSRIA